NLRRRSILAPPSHHVTAVLLGFPAPVRSPILILLPLLLLEHILHRAIQGLLLLLQVIAQGLDQAHLALARFAIPVLECVPHRGPRRREAVALWARRCHEMTVEAGIALSIYYTGDPGELRRGGRSLDHHWVERLGTSARTAPH